MIRAAGRVLSSITLSATRLERMRGQEGIGDIPTTKLQGELKREQLSKWWLLATSVLNPSAPMRIIDRGSKYTHSFQWARLLFGRSARRRTTLYSTL